MEYLTNEEISAFEDLAKSLIQGADVNFEIESCYELTFLEETIFQVAVKEEGVYVRKINEEEPPYVVVDILFEYPFPTAEQDLVHDRGQTLFKAMVSLLAYVSELCINQIEEPGEEEYEEDSDSDITDGNNSTSSDTSADNRAGAEYMRLYRLLNSEDETDSDSDIDILGEYYCSDNKSQDNSFSCESSDISR